jgi:itaconyl-CoA hydratase
MARLLPDYHVGTTVTTRGVTVTETHLVGWANLTGDWLPLHMDEEYASTTQFGGRLAHGPLTLALALGLSTQIGLFDPESAIAWLGLDEVRATNPVRPGDTIRADVEILEARPSRTPGQGVLRLGYRVRNQRGDQVLSFVNALLIKA